MAAVAPGVSSGLVVVLGGLHVVVRVRALAQRFAVADGSSGSNGSTTTSWRPAEMKRVYTSCTLSSSPVSNRLTTADATWRASSYVGLSLKPEYAASIAKSRKRK